MRRRAIIIDLCLDALASLVILAVTLWSVWAYMGGL